LFAVIASCSIGGCSQAEGVVESHLNRRTDVASPPTSPGARPGRFPFRTPATLALLLLTVGAFAGQVAAGGDAAERTFGLIPARLSGPSSLTDVAGGQPIPAWLTPLTYMFLHHGWWHLALNMAGLSWLGWYAEPAMGTRRFVLAYLFFGVVTGLTIVLLGPHWTRPFVGASGAISGVLGAFLLHVISFLAGWLGVRLWRHGMKLCRG
jgi:membrane associated rhomboid family serine protease